MLKKVPIKIIRKKTPMYRKYFQYGLIDKLPVATKTITEKKLISKKISVIFNGVPNSVHDLINMVAIEIKRENFASLPIYSI